MQDEVKVSQADERAVAEFHRQSFETLFATTDADIDAGINRAHTLLCQAFARHRHQAERETLARMEWRDIESAPKDGSGVLMIDMNAPTPEASTAYFYEDKWWLLAEGDRSREDGAWAYNCPWYATPTHWMPLPPAPEAGQ